MIYNITEEQYRELKVRAEKKGCNIEDFLSSLDSHDRAVIINFVDKHGGSEGLPDLTML